jgi:hypothetical protein
MLCTARAVGEGEVDMIGVGVGEGVKVEPGGEWEDEADVLHRGASVEVEQARKWTT